MARASKKYESAVKLIDFDQQFDDEAKAAAKKIKLAVFSNQAACKLKLKDYSAAIAAASKALDIDGSSVKVLFRRAQASVALDFWDDAENDLRKALEIEPDNKDVKLEQARLKKKQAEQDKKGERTARCRFDRAWPGCGRVFLGTHSGINS